MQEDRALPCCRRRQALTLPGKAAAWGISFPNALGWPRQYERGPGRWGLQLAERWPLRPTPTLGGAVHYALSSGICQTITEDTTSSGGCCRAFRHTRRWPWPPHTTSTELALAFLGRRALFLGGAVWSFKRSQVLLSSDLCSSELEPWDKLRDPDEEDRSLF